MLRLLAQRDQGYEDLAALMGLGVDEVVVKARQAVAQLEEEGIPAPALPPAPAAAAPAAAPKAPPEPRKPEPPAAVAAPKPSPVPPKRTARTPRSRPTVPQSGGARAAIAGGVAVTLLVVVVLAIGGSGDSSDSTSATTATTGSEETASNAAANSKLTQAALSPVDGGDASGVATFGRVKNSLALQVEAEGLEPTGKGESYTVWLYESPQKMLPLASTAVDDSGKIGAQVEVPTEVLAYLAKETFDQIDISLTSNAALKASLAKATSEKEAPIYTGADVLRGTITGPIIGASR